MVKVVIAFYGESGAGKGSVVDFLKDHYDGSRMHCFADALKKSVHTIFGVPYSLLYGPKAVKDSYVHKQTGLTLRSILQEVGKMFRGAFGKTVWVDALVSKLEVETADIVFIEDGRFPEEELFYFEQRVKEIGREFLSIRIVPDYEGYEPLPGNDESETSLSRVDQGVFGFVIHNRSLDATKGACKIIVGEFLEEVGLR